LPLKYEQIAASLRARIDSGEFAPGSTLPSGRDLCEQWGVSRATVNKAYESLKDDGIVAGRQGAGYVVTTVPLARPAGNRTSGATRTQGMPFKRLGTPSLEYPSPRVRAELGIADGVPALRRARLQQMFDGTPHSVVTAWFPSDLSESCPKLMQAGPIIEGTTRYIERCTGRTPRHGRDQEDVRLGTEEEARLLRKEMPFAVHCLLHVAVDQHGLVLVVEDGVTPQDSWQRVTDYPMR
jgi:DNA-binding GntR family transcriptional regulator